MDQWNHTVLPAEATQSETPTGAGYKIWSLGWFMVCVPKNGTNKADLAHIRDFLHADPTSWLWFLPPQHPQGLTARHSPTSSMRNSAAAPPVLWISNGSVGC